MRLWKRKPALGIGIGVGVLGAVALAVLQSWVERKLRQQQQGGSASQPQSGQPRQLEEPQPGGAAKGKGAQTQFEASLWRQAKRLSSKLRK